MQIHSGYKTITPIQLANAIWALDEGLIDHGGLRVYLAGFAMVAVREAAQRYRRKRREKAREFSRYQLHELERLTGLNGAKVRRALRQLERAGLMAFTEGEVNLHRETLPGSEGLQSTLSCRRSPRRPIPVPRSMLRFLAQNRSEALAKVVIAYMVRGLAITRETGIISSKGTVKASWIAETFGLSQRGVKYAQAVLRALNWITKDTQSLQRKLNRDGAYFVINMDWKLRRQATASARKNESVGAEEGRPFVNRDKTVVSFAPPGPGNAPTFAPPIENKKTSIENKHQRTQLAEAPGVCGEVGKNVSLPEPSLDNIRREDLHHFSRLERLYVQTVERGWIQASEAKALNFIAAAVRAREVGDDPVRLFVSLVRKGLWHHITQAQEDYARRALVRYRKQHTEHFRCHNDDPNQRGSIRFNITQLVELRGSTDATDKNRSNESGP